MPAALLKQSKGLRFLTLRRCARPFPEIASAAGRADACGYCSPQNCAGRSLGARRPATAFASLRSPQATARKLSHYYVCGSLSRAVRRRPTAADCNSPMARACPAAVGEQQFPNRFAIPILTRRLGGKAQDGAVRKKTCPDRQTRKIPESRMRLGDSSYMQLNTTCCSCLHPPLRPSALPDLQCRPEWSSRSRR